MSEKITLRSILDLLVKNKKLLIIGQFITAIGIIVSVPIPLLLPVLVDEVLLDKPAFFVTNIDAFFGSGNAFYYIAIVTFGVILLRFLSYVFEVITTKIFTAISKIVIYEIRLKLLTHLKRVSINEYESLGSGKVSANLINDVNTLDNFIANVASKFVTSVLTLLAVSFVILSIDVLLGIMILLTQPLIAILSRKIAKKTEVLKKSENASVEAFSHSITETTDLFSQIKASNKEEFFFSDTVQKAKAIQLSSNEFNFKSVAYERFSHTMFLIAFEIFRSTGLLLVAYGDLSIGLMFAMFGYIWFIMAPVQNILSLQYTLASAKAAMARVNKIFDLELEKSGEILLVEKDIEIKLEDLGFSYNKDSTTLVCERWL